MNSEGSVPFVHTHENQRVIDGQLTKFLRSSNHKILVLHGSWGSGKTVAINNFISSNKDKYSFNVYSLFGRRTPEECLTSLTPFLFRLPFVVLFSLIFAIFVELFRYAVSGSDIKALIETFGSIFVLSAGYYLVHNWNRFNYLISQFLFTAILRNETVTVIEDIDRSSLGESDRWAVLSNLWTYKRKYIVLLGYNGDSEKVSNLQQISKIEAEYIELGIDPYINAAIASKFEKDFPFKMADWMELYTPREILFKISEVKRNLPHGSNQFRLQAELVKSFFKDTMQRALGEDFRGFQSVHIGVSNGDLNTILSNTILTAEANKRYVKSFGPSVSTQLLRHLEAVFVQRDSATNQLAVTIQNMLGESKESLQILSRI